MIENEELASILPHKGRMLLLSRVTEYNLEERNICAEYDITEDCLFYDPVIKGVPAWAAFEFLAQSIAAISGLWSISKGEKPKMGFILSVSSMRMFIPFFNTGVTLGLKVTLSGSMDQVFNFDGEVFLEGRKVIEGKLTVMEADEDQIKLLIKEMN